MSVFNSLLFMLLVFWSIPLIRALVVHQRLPRSQPMLCALLLMPLLLLDQSITGAGEEASLLFLLGAFDTLPAIIGLLLLEVSGSVTRQGYRLNWWLHGSAILILCLLQGLYLQWGPEQKIQFLILGEGDWQQGWPLYLHSALMHLYLLMLAYQAFMLVSYYRLTLPRQVVDVKLYQLHGVAGAWGICVALSALAVVVSLLVMSGGVSMPNWQASISVAEFILFGCLCVLLLVPERYSPSPILALRSGSYSQVQLTQVMDKAERSMIDNKAYKIIGLRLSAFAAMAGVNPKVLAVALRELTHRNFRGFVFYYRLEYARNVMLRTDARVLAVAERLGFTSERFLSDMFINYLTRMGEGRQIAEKLSRLPE